MQEKIISIVVALLSLLGAFLSKKTFVYEDNFTMATNYMDVRFIDVHARNNSRISITDDGNGIVLKSLNISNQNKKEVITYQIINNSSSFDISMSIFINGKSNYENEYYTISCSELGQVNRGEITEGYITIELKKDLDGEIEIPFNIQIDATPIQKKYLF